MIIFAGVQWITSGGNSEAITKSKKRIGGAVIGLFIAYMSFFILNTINPALVKLRLPQVYLFRPFTMMPEFCSEVEESKEGKVKFMLAAGTDKKNERAEIKINNAVGKSEGYKWSYKESPEMFWCAKRFFAESGGQTSCWGDYCEVVEGGGGRKMCLDWESGFTCLNANVGGTIRNTAIIKDNVIATIVTEEWESPPVERVWLIGYCNKKFTALEAKYSNFFYEKTVELGEWLGDDGYAEEMSDGGILVGKGEIANLPNKQVFYIKIREVAIEQMSGFCQDGGTKGYVLQAWMDEVADSFEEIHYIGRGGVDLGDKARGGDTGFFDRHVYDIDNKYFFTLDEIRGTRQKRAGDGSGNYITEAIGGLRVNFDASNVYDIDRFNPLSGLSGDDLRNKFYSRYLK